MFSPLPAIFNLSVEYKHSICAVVTTRVGESEFQPKLSQAEFKLLREPTQRRGIHHSAVESNLYDYRKHY